MKNPYVFDEFFASGMEESISPFLTPKSRLYGKNLHLKSGLGAAFLLIAAFGVSFHFPPLSHFFLSCVYFLVGVPALIASMSDLKNLEINIDVLMTVAAFIAVLLGSSLEGALLLVLFELSHGMEDAVSKKAKSAIHHLHHLAPKFAFLVNSDGNLYEKAIREVGIGEKILVKNGEVVPLDGKVIEGHSSVNLVHLTGESIPVQKKPGDIMPAGARNLESALTIEVTRTSSDSTLARIIQLITQAQEAKPKLQRWLDRFGKHYATSIILLTCFFALSLPFFFSTGYFGHEGSIYRALAFLIAASPCALIIATPTAYLSAISACAKKGILLKGGITLDALSSCSTIAFDKTGTLTTGDLICTAIEPLGDPLIPANTALSIAYGLERNVVHPIATALCNLAVSKNIPPAKIDSFKAIPGLGLEGIFESKSIFIGVPEKIMSRLSSEDCKKMDEWLKTKSGVLAALTIDNDTFLFHFSDQIRQDAKALIANIQFKNNLNPIMLTGDNRQNAETVGKGIGIKSIYADLKPEDKLEKVAQLSELGGLAMVGDGINDAPALARATVGISMGKIGSATAVDASDVVLLNDDLYLLSFLFSKSRQTLRIVKQNLTLALCVIGFATIPALLGFVPLWAAVIMHEGGTVLVGLNSLRLLGTVKK
ncbi:MAG TPA: heavy metal translocating P-type ATPase [Chlamydiales bacterium]|nr:heavy metal translocating P-type ATPase [Chlamydiales bacterium]